MKSSEQEANVHTVLISWQMLFVAGQTSSHSSQGGQGAWCGHRGGLAITASDRRVGGAALGCVARRWTASSAGEQVFCGQLSVYCQLAPLVRDGEQGERTNHS